MNSMQELSDLNTITTARYEQRRQKFSELVAEENLLRAELGRLDEMARQSQDPEAVIGEMRTIGADLLWQGWVGRSKAALNLRLAQVLAVKEHHLTEVRRAYGKVLVVQEMQDTQKKGKRRNLENAALSQAISLSVQR